MNHYELTLTEDANEGDLKAIALLFINAANFRIQKENNKTIFFGSLKFSLDGLGSNALQVNSYSSSHRQTVEGFDKPIVEKSDLIVALVQGSKSDQIGKFYNDFIRIENAVSTPQKTAKLTDKKGTIHEVAVINKALPKPMDIYIGLSNSNQTDTNKPFDISEMFVIVSQKRIKQVLKA